MLELNSKKFCKIIYFNSLPCTFKRKLQSFFDWLEIIYLIINFDNASSLILLLFILISLIKLFLSF